MTRTASALVATLAGVCVLGSGVTGAAPHGQSAQVWSTRGRCTTPRRVRVTITYHDKAVYRGVLALCHGHPADLPATEPRVTTFSFFGRPRDFAPSSPAEGSRQIDGRLWEVAADAEAARIGVAFLAAGEILLNATHAVSPEATSRNTIAISTVISSEPPAAR